MEVPSFPTSPERVLMITPDKRPARPAATSADGLTAISDAFTVVIAAVTTSFFWVPYPTTTTSSKACKSSFRMILKDFLFCVGYSCVM